MEPEAKLQQHTFQVMAIKGVSDPLHHQVDVAYHTLTCLHQEDRETCCNFITELVLSIHPSCLSLPFCIVLANITYNKYSQIFYIFICNHPGKWSECSQNVQALYPSVTPFMHMATTEKYPHKTVYSYLPIPIVFVKNVVWGTQFQFLSKIDSPNLNLGQPAHDNVMC